MTPIVILAGGKSSRMGTDKTRLPFGNETLLERAYRRFSRHFDEVVISANADVGIPGVRVIRDVFPGLGPISGLHAAMLEFPSVFLVAADMPFADPLAAKNVIETGRGFIACAGESNRGVEPLFAFYSKRLFADIEQAIEAGDYSLHRLLSRVATNHFAVDSQTLVNINRPEDYEKLKSHIELNGI